MRLRSNAASKRKRSTETGQAKNKQAVAWPITVTRYSRRPQTQAGWEMKWPRLYPGSKHHWTPEHYTHLWPEVRVSSKFFNSCRVPAMYSGHTVTMQSSSVPLLSTSRISGRAANVPCHATALVLAPYSRLSLQYSSQMLVGHAKSLEDLETKEWASILFVGHRDSVAIDLMSLVLKSEGRTKLIVEILDRYSKLSKASKATNTPAAIIVNISMDHSVTTFLIPSTVQADKRSHFTFRSFAALCKEVVFRTVRTTEYLLQFNRQTRRFSMTIISRIYH